MTRRIVTVWSKQPVTLRLFRQLPQPDIHMAPDPEHDPVTLVAGENAGVDAGFFAAWLEQNKDFGLVRSGEIHASEPNDAEDPAQQREDDDGS